MTRSREVIECRACKGTNCTVDEIFQEEKISMEEYARRYPRVWPSNPLDYSVGGRTARRFVITCQDCGEQYEFLERIEPLPQMMADW